MQNNDANEGGILMLCKRSYRVDLLKAFAIIGVLLYHAGVLANGYLGVEVFFVISGYFLMNSYLRRKDSASFRIVTFLANRIIRLWPLILMICLSCLVIGCFSMLPDDFENLGESAVASSAFLNNVLAAITTKDYWNLSNNYKPLMHLWYVGVLVQCEVFLIILFSMADRFGRNALRTTVAAISIISFVLFLMPYFSDGDKFYYIPFRLFEVLAGAGICFIGIDKRIPNRAANCIFGGISILIIVMMLFELPLSAGVLLIIETLLTAVAIFVATHSEEPENSFLKGISKIGLASFSIYVVHQPIMAFTRYFYTAELKGVVLAVVLLLTAVISVLFFFLFEKGIDRALRKIGWIKGIIACILGSVIIIGGGLFVYLNAGVVRDVPELDVYKATAYRGMHAEYVDVPYSWNRDFSTNRLHILVVGDSMARDWANILNESDRSDEFEISYVFASSFDQSYIDRANKADYIFYSILDDSTENMPETLKQYSHDSNFYIVGIKNFGENNGQVYQKRNRSDYFKSTIIMGKTNSKSRISFEDLNQKQRDYWGNRYIDMIECIRNDDGTIPVFTDTCKYISADTIHLTKNGAIYYGEILDLSFIQ